MYLTLTHIEDKHLEKKEPPGESTRNFKNMLKLSQYICLFEKKMQYLSDKKLLNETVNLTNDCIFQLNKSQCEMNEKFNIYINLKERGGV